MDRRAEAGTQLTTKAEVDRLADTHEFLCQHPDGWVAVDADHARYWVDNDQTALWECGFSIVTVENPLQTTPEETVTYYHTTPTHRGNAILEADLTPTNDISNDPFQKGICCTALSEWAEEWAAGLATHRTVAEWSVVGITLLNPSPWSVTRTRRSGRKSTESCPRDSSSRSTRHSATNTASRSPRVNS